MNRKWSLYRLVSILLAVAFAAANTFSAFGLSSQWAPPEGILAQGGDNGETSLAQQTGASTYKQYFPVTPNGEDEPAPIDDPIDVPLDWTGTGWAMAGANPQRTSWTPDEVRGQLQVAWYKPFEPYIHAKVQVIATEGLLYIATANGLYALDAASGAEKWVYPTELPLGSSPTIAGGVAYAAGFDHKLHAIDAKTGKRLWTFTAGAGFDTSPLVLGGLALLGSRDGYFYAVYTKAPNAGRLAWKFKTGGPISYSAAFKDGVVYFASDDSYAYALDAVSGKLIWKSAKLPGAGFHSWWPVVAGNSVIFTGATNFRTSVSPGPAVQYSALELDQVYPKNDSEPRGTLAGPLGSISGSWAAGTPTIDASRSSGSTLPITEYLEQKPWRRTVIVLNRSNGKEITSDFDQDGKAEYAPILWFGTHSGNRYPPVVGADGVLYQANNYMSDPYIAGGQVSGWMPGTPYLSIVSSDWTAVDEPMAVAAGGSVIYWNQCCDRSAGAIDVSKPNTGFLQNYQSGSRPATAFPDANREWLYFDYDLDRKIPGYNLQYYNGTSESIHWVYGSRNGPYGVHGSQNPPIPYQGKVYMHRGNTLIAFAPGGGSSAKALPMARTVSVPKAAGPVDAAALQARLAEEVRKIVDAGHLRPGYYPSGIFDFRGSRWCGDRMVDYWHTPGDTLVALLRALPYLPADLQARTRTYLQQEFKAYPPYQVAHIGWNSGAPREVFDLPVEVQNDLKNFGPADKVFDFAGWSFPPQSFYAMWKYAQEFGGAKAIFDAAKSKLAPAASDDFLKKMPHVHNAFLAGYLGYLELEKLAGYPETAAVRQEYNRLLNLRLNSFSKDTPDAYFQNPDEYYCRALGVSRNFIDLTPELAAQMRANLLPQVEAALAEYAWLAPYWFVSNFDVTFGEGVNQPLYDTFALFQARAMILQQPAGELVRYLDVPGFQRGDLFYVHNLAALLEAAN